MCCDKYIVDGPSLEKEIGDAHSKSTKTLRNEPHSSIASSRCGTDGRRSPLPTRIAYGKMRVVRHLATRAFDLYASQSKAKRIRSEKNDSSTLCVPFWGVEGNKEECQVGYNATISDIKKRAESLSESMSNVWDTIIYTAF